MIQMFHVSKRYGGENPALSDINLSIGKAEFVFVTGPSGAGKTTLLKLIYCAEKPTDGQILVAGRNISRMRNSAIPYLRRNIGVVFQDFKLIENRTVFENVALSLEVLWVSRREIAKKVFRILKDLGISHKMHKYPPQLSGGEQQRVAIARALVNEPSIVLADEPTGNLDGELKFEVINILKEANLKGSLILVATHDSSLISKYSRRVVVLERGRLIEDRG